jgi:hypothetical protein
MGKKAGALLWNRMRLTLANGLTDVDTGLTQLNKSFDSESVGEPPLGVNDTAAPAPGTLPASRIQVVPMAPTALWVDISHSEPYFNTTTGTIHVEFSNSGKTPAGINVLFWDPHSMIGPGDADPYNDEEGEIEPDPG